MLMLKGSFVLSVASSTIANPTTQSRTKFVPKCYRHIWMVRLAIAIFPLVQLQKKLIAKANFQESKL